MIEYEYQCTNPKCGVNFSVKQSIKDKAYFHCSECEEQLLERVIHIGIAIFKEGVHDKTTLGRLAEINTKKLGKYHKEDLREEHKESKLKAKEALQHEMADKTGSKPIDVREKPWYRKVGANKINKMTPAQREKYVKTGTE